MKKFMLLMLVISVALFGASTGSKSSVGSEDSGASVVFGMAGAKAQPMSQITIHVPVNIDPVPEGMQVSVPPIYTRITNGKQRIVCYVYKDGTNPTIQRSKDVQAGNHTVTLHFSGIPENELLKFDKYTCNLTYDTSNEYPFSAGWVNHDLLEAGHNAGVSGDIEY